MCIPYMTIEEPGYTAFTMSSAELKIHKRSKLNRFLILLALVSGFSGLLVQILLDLTGFTPAGSSDWNLPVQLGVLFAFFIGSFAEWGHVLEAANHDDVQQPSRAKAWFFSVMTLIWLLWAIGSLLTS